MGSSLILKGMGGAVKGKGVGFWRVRIRQEAGH